MKSPSSQIALFFLVAILIAPFVDVSHAQQWDGPDSWHNETEYSKTYVVDQRHPLASDSNPGTPSAPLKTVNRAAELVKAGERVVIHAGVYRELVEPLHGGTGPEDMVAYEAAAGEEVIIKGSRVVSTPWVQRSVYTDVLPDSTLQYTWSRKIWMNTLSDSLFEEGYYPFRLPNILPEEHTLMPWANLVKDLSPYTSSRGMIWQNGTRMVQVEEYGDLARLPGSFWVDVDGKTVHVHPYGGGAPHQHLFEVGSQSHLFRPKKVGLGYIHLRGITFMHCPNGFLRTSTGAVTTRGGHHWIIEGNEIMEVNSAALEFGYYAFEFRDPSPENIQPRTDADLGGMIVRGNRISEAGTAGIRSYTVTDGIIEHNTIWNVGWQDAQNYWECSGIKLLRTRNTVVKENHIYNITGGNGIWMDWDIRQSRVTRNIIHDVQTVQGGIFVEASQVPNLVDHNIIVDIDGSGIYANDSDSTLIYHNLIVNTTGPIVEARVATERQLSGRWLTANYNRVLNNIFVDRGEPVRFESTLNEVDNNLYVFTRGQLPVEGENNVARVALGYNMKAGYLQWESANDLPQYAIPSGLVLDFFNRPRSGETVIPGPFRELGGETPILLHEGY